MGARATMTLGKINGKLRRRLTAGDIPGTIGQIEELAQTAAQLEAAGAALREAASRTPSPHDATRAVRLTLTDQPSLRAAHIRSGS
jgi:hypothetical protein